METPDEMRDVDLRRTPPAPVIAAGVVAALVGIGLLGWMVYRSRRSRSIAARLQDVVPDSVSELRDRLRSQFRR